MVVGGLFFGELASVARAGEGLSTSYSQARQRSEDRDVGAEKKATFAEWLGFGGGHQGAQVLLFSRAAPKIPEHNRNATIVMKYSCRCSGDRSSAVRTG